jgi:gamma-glutamylaminecyclotransferase
MSFAPRDPTLLFVYGSLKRGERNHRMMSGAVFIAEALTVARYGFCVLGDYPALLRRGERAVAGELYRADARALRDLDLFEGVDYVRDWVRLSDEREAQAYFLAPARTRAASPLTVDSWSGVQRPV